MDITKYIGMDVHQKTQLAGTIHDRLRSGRFMDTISSVNLKMLGLPWSIHRDWSMSTRGVE